MFHAVPRWWRWRRRRQRRPELVWVDCSTGAPAAVPTQCTGDLAAITELLIAGQVAGDIDQVVADLRALSVALLALPDQLAAEDREQGGDTVWGRDARAAGYACAALEATTRPARTVECAGRGAHRPAPAACGPSARRNRGAAATSAGDPDSTPRPPWLIDRDLDAVAAHLDPWILAAEPDHDASTTAIPLFGTPEWVATDEVTRNAAVALYVIACLAEREPVVIAARLAAEIAAGRTRYLVALRQASQRDQRGHVPPPPAQALAMKTSTCAAVPVATGLTGVRLTSVRGGSVRRHSANPTSAVVRVLQPFRAPACLGRAP